MLTLRLATMDDWARTYHLRNDPETRAQSFNSDVISLEEHMKWLDEVLAKHDDSVRLYVATDTTRGTAQIGTCRLDKRGKKALELSITIDPHRRGDGYAEQVIAAAVDLARTDFVEQRPAKLLASIKPDNYQSLRAFAACGFKPVTITPERVDLEFTL